MAQSAKKPTSKDWLPCFRAKHPPLSRAGIKRLGRAIATLQADGVDIGSLCGRVIGLKNFPNQKPSTILSPFSSADQRRIKVLPRNLREIASVLKKEGFDRFLRWGALSCPSLIETLNYLSRNDEGMFPMRGDSKQGDRSLKSGKILKGDLLLKLPEILEDVAQAIENVMRRPPQIATFAMRITYIVGQVEAKSRSRREHYQEILDILDPEGHSPLTYDGLKNLVARQRARQRNRSHQSK